MGTDWMNVRVRESLRPTLNEIRDRIVADFALAGQTIPRPSQSYAAEAAIRTLSGIHSGEIVSLPLATFAALMGDYAAYVFKALGGGDVEAVITEDGIEFRMDGKTATFPKPDTSFVPSPRTFATLRKG